MRNANHEWQANVSKAMRRGILSVLLLWILKRKGTPMYGYEIIQTIDERTKGTWAPKAGTIYPMLRRLEGKGYVKSEWGSGSAGPARRYYRITTEGKEATKALFAEWKKLMSGFRGFLSDLLGGNLNEQQLRIETNNVSKKVRRTCSRKQRQHQSKAKTARTARITSGE